MDKIQIHDKSFETYISYEEIQVGVEKVAKQIASDMENDQPLFLCVLNGVFMFAADLFKYLNIPCELSFVKLASYDGMGSTGNTKQLIGLNENLKERHVIILEDIVDTGNTIVELHKRLTDLEVASIKIATLFMKPEAYTKSLNIDYVGMEISNQFIVGYGLDYDGLGRNLKDIYIYRS